MGVLTLLEGSALPAEGQGVIKVFMDSRISKDSSGALASQFLGNGEIPIYLELKFNVGVDVSFGLQHFGTTAPFDKKCGMNIGGMFERSQNKLGPLLCRSSFDELHRTGLPHLGDAPPGAECCISARCSITFKFLKLSQILSSQGIPEKLRASGYQKPYLHPSRCR